MSRSSSMLSQYSKLPPITGVNDEPQASCQSIQDVELTFDAAREETKTLLQQLAEHTTLIEARVEERLKATLKKTTKFLSDQSHCMEQLHSQELVQLRKQLKEMAAAKEDLAKREKALVDQQTRISIDLAAEVRARKQADHKLEKLQIEHAEEQQKMEAEWEKERAKQSNSLEKELLIVHQLKEEVHKHAEEVKKLRDQLQKERTEKKKLEQEYSDDENKLSASNKKLVLEVSKLKAQIQSANNSLTTVNQQNNLLERKISQMEKDHAAATKTATAHHGSTVKSLEEKIAQLQQEMVQMQIKYQQQIDDLLRQLHQSQAKAESLLAFDEAAAFEDAKIRKLRLQNKEEKRLLEKERHTGPKKTVKLIS